MKSRLSLVLAVLPLLCMTLAAQVNPVPFINNPLVPDAVAPGGPGFTLTVNGTGFVPSSVVNWNGNARATTFVSSSQLIAAILGSDIATASTTSVTVLNPGPGGGPSNVVFFPITLPSSSVALSRSDLNASSFPDDVATGDFNRDGKLDLVVANSGSSSVSIFLGNGDGTFQTRVDYATAGAPDWPVVGDFNRDGNLDLALRSEGDAAVSVLLGNGDGTFAPHNNYPVGSQGALAAGDFNGDGRLDLATTANGEDKVYILLGNSDGTFRSAVAYPAGSFPIGITVSDLNEDGKLDLAVADLNGDAVSILLGNGDGTFQFHVEFASGSGPAWINAADFNGDGTPDLVVCDQLSSAVSILLGNGDGTFQANVDYPLESGTYASSVGDFNGDSKLDLAVTVSASGTVSLLLGNGDGTFELPTNDSTGAYPFGLALGDFNGDGRLDLAVANYGGNTISVLLQTAVVSLSATSVQFGLQLVGSRSDAQFSTLTNTGPITLNISSIVATGDFLQHNDCGTSLPAGQSCTITVKFSPTTKGDHSGAITITDNAGGSPQTITLTGTGTVVDLSSFSLGFGDQQVGTTSQPKTITLTNRGAGLLRFAGFAITGANAGDFAESTTCGEPLSRGASCTVTVTFTPQAKGARQAYLAIADNGGGSPQHVNLSGNGI